MATASEFAVVSADFSVDVFEPARAGEAGTQISQREALATIMKRDNKHCEFCSQKNGLFSRGRQEEGRRIGAVIITRLGGPEAEYARSGRKGPVNFISFDRRSRRLAHYVVLDRILKQFSVRLQTEGFHHLVFVKCHCAWFEVQHTGDFFHGEAFGE